MGRVTEILSELESAGEKDGDVRVEYIADHLGHRSLGVLLMVPAALELTPVGAIPAIPTILAAIVALIAVQLLIGRDDLWLPDVLERRTVSAKRLRSAVETLRPLAEWADRHLGRHLEVLVEGPATRLAALAILGLCATVPALELVPFASSIPMGTVVLFGAGMLTRDGRVMALAWVATIAAAVSLWFLWP